MGQALKSVRMVNNIVEIYLSGFHENNIDENQRVVSARPKKRRKSMHEFRTEHQAETGGRN